MESSQPAKPVSPFLFLIMEFSQPAKPLLFPIMEFSQPAKPLLFPIMEFSQPAKPLLSLLFPIMEFSQPRSKVFDFLKPGHLRGVYAPTWRETFHLSPELQVLAAKSCGQSLPYYGILTIALKGPDGGPESAY